MANSAQRSAKPLYKFTSNLLNSDEVIDRDQDPLGKPGRHVAVNDRCEIWARDLEDGSKPVGLFNRGEAPATAVAKWTDLGLTGKQMVRDLWRQKDLAACQDQFETSVPRHGVVLVRLRPE